jgi:hypothetical protein
MALSTTPHTITSASPSYTLASGNTLQTTGIAVTNAYTAGLSPQVVNSGTIRETGITNSANDVAIFLNAGTAGTTSILNNSTGLISGAAYGVVIGGGNSSTLHNRATITNFGTINQSGETGNSDSAIKFSTGTGGAVVNSGFLSGQYGGVYFKTADAASLTVINNVGGTITNSGGGRAVTFNDFASNGNIAGSSATFINAGVINGLVEFDVANGGATATNAGTITGQIKSSGGGGTLTLDAGEKLTGGAAFNFGGTLDFAAGTVAVGTINTSGAYTGFNSATILSGADFNIGNPTAASSIAGVTSIADFGTLNVAGSLSNTTINMEGSLGSKSVVDFTGTNTSTPLTNYGASDQIVISTLAIAPGSGESYQDSYNTATGVLTINELNSLGSTIGTANVTVSGTSALSSGSFVNVAGPGGDTVVLGSSPILNAGSIYLDYGETATLSNTTLDNVNVTFGTHGSLAGPNVLELDGPSTFISSGIYTNNLGTISGFGTNDIIVIGTSDIAALPTDVLTTGYNANGYQIFDQSEYMRIVGSVGALAAYSLSTDFVTFSPAGGYSVSSFVETYGTNGINIETPTTDAEQGYTFNAGSGTANINTPLDYSGLVSPGDSIVSGEVVTIASGTATFTPTTAESNTGYFQNSGTILVSGSSSAFTDYGTLAGGGTVIAANGGQINLDSSTGTDAAQSLDFGTGGVAGALNMIDLNPTSGSFAGTIGGFGLGDDIVVGTSILPSLATGSSVSLSYAGSLLTVAEVNSAGSVTASTTIDVGTGYSTASFVALVGTNGINIETPATVAEQGFTFSTSGTGNFQTPTDYIGGVAPGQTIYPGEDVTVVAGTASISAAQPVTDNGTIIVTGPGAGLIDSSTLSGSGTIAIAGGANVTLANTIGTDTGTVYFGTGGTAIDPNLLDLTVPGTTGFSGTIANFGTFDTIILGSSVLPSSTPGSVISFSTVVSGGHETLTVTTTTNGTIHTDNVTFASPPPGVFNVTQGPQGIVISDMPCFAAGSRILTPDGQVQVEQLAVGDVVLTANGAEQEIIWVGSRTIDLARHAMPEKVRPVRILAGAFGAGLPERDLLLSPDHALFIDGHLIEAKTLVNGVTVLRENAVRHVTYHHIELASHDVLLAEGLPAESYLESGNRLMFESDAAPMMLHPDFAALSRAKACAPLAVDGDVVITARQALLERAASLGFAATADIDLVVYADGVALAPLTGLGTVMHFALPAGVKKLELVSSTGVPAELGADPSDRRELGVAVNGLALIAGGARTEIAIDDEAHQGFHAAEPAHRWTAGRAVVALPPVAGGTVLEVTINGQAARWTRRAA